MVIAVLEQVCEGSLERGHALLGERVEDRSHWALRYARLLRAGHIRKLSLPTRLLARAVQDLKQPGIVVDHVPVGVELQETIRHCIGQATQELPLLLEGLLRGHLRGYIDERIQP